MSAARFSTAFTRMQAFLKAEGIPFSAYVEPEELVLDLKDVAAIFNTDGSFLRWSNH